ncbi:MAG TPA: hypothetical protein VKU38_09380 [Ktedonobacteraceae bacterium]|nr:hypothetical protein [Ktedonobacteraceae bacterium]
MAKKIPVASKPPMSRPREDLILSAPPVVHEDSKPRTLWLWFSSILIVGILLLGIGSFFALGLLKNFRDSLSPVATPAPITTLNVHRTAMYAGLDFTVTSVQYATSFADDDMHSSQGIVRLNMIAANKSPDHINVIYYDIARLLLPKSSPITPSNVNLSVDPASKTSASGWIDFPVNTAVQLSTLKLQLGSTTLGETLVTIPFSGAFDPGRYSDRTSQQGQTFNYYFHGQLLVYNLVTVDIRYSYQGVQAKAGQQYYSCNFRVDNPNGVSVAPGYGFDYLRLVLNGSLRPPVINTLSYSFNANTQGTTGRVVFIAPAGLKTLSLDFLVQYGSGGTDYTVTL